MNPTIIYPEASVPKASNGRPLRILASEHTQAYTPASEPKHESASAEDVRLDKIINKWAVFERTIGKFTARRDIVQVMRAPRGIVSMTGGDLIEVVVDQEYFFMTDHNTQAGSWLSLNTFPLMDGILAYAYSFSAWHEHCAVRSHFPTIPTKYNSEEA